MSFNGMLQRWVLGLKPGSETGSNIRRMISRVSVLISIPSLFYLSLVPDLVIKKMDYIYCLILVLWSFFYFVFVVLTIPFLSSHNFRPNPVRLFVDGLISITLTIIGFAIYYSIFGVNGPSEAPIVWTDYLYFSAVTFSTLGYGDFQPAPQARLLASFEAIVGNLHLAIIVGAAFLSASQPFSSAPEEKGENGEND